LNKAIVTTSWDDGCPLDLKLAELLSKYEISATFYIPLSNIERETLTNKAIRDISLNFDIGGHSLNHVDLAKINPEIAVHEIIGCKDRLEQIVDRNISSFCYPYGKYRPETTQMVKNAGFNCARTINQCRRTVKNPFEFGTTIHAKEYPVSHYCKHSMLSLDSYLFMFLLKSNLFTKSWERIAVETLDFVISNGGIWHLWGHSWEIQENNGWDKLERVLHYIYSIRNEIRILDNSKMISSVFDSNLPR
jgi:peptidoglycan-N-acetylglucosamine deacetylase